MATDQPPDDESQLASEDDTPSSAFLFPEIRPLSDDMRPKQKVDKGALFVLGTLAVALIVVGWLAGLPFQAIKWGVVLIGALGALGMQRKR